MPPDPHRVQIADRIRLQHILEAAADALKFMAGRARADLDADSMLARAVLHAIQEIGEAASQIGDETRARVRDVPWSQIVGMRHRLVHVYWGVNLNLVHEVVVRDLPALISAINAATANWPMPPSGEGGDQPPRSTDTPSTPATGSP